MFRPEKKLQKLPNNITFFGPFLSSACPGRKWDSVKPAFIYLSFFAFYAFAQSNLSCKNNQTFYFLWLPPATCLL